MPLPRPPLYVCVSCRRRGAERVAEGEQTDGRRLYEAVKSLADGMGQDAPAQSFPRSASPIASAAAAWAPAPGKWSYLVGEIGPEHAADLFTYATAYARRTGVVLPSRPPASLQTRVIARFPAPFEPVKDAAE